MATLVSQALLHRNQKTQQYNVTLMSIEHRIWHPPLWIIEAPSYLGDLRSSYGYGLLGVTWDDLSPRLRWCRNKRQFMDIPSMIYWVLLNDLSPKLRGCRNKRQFKDIPSNICLYSSERTLDKNGWGPRFNTDWGNILLLDFWFSHGKAIIANSVCLW